MSAICHDTIYPSDLCKITFHSFPNLRSHVDSLVLASENDRLDTGRWDGNLRVAICQASRSIYYLFGWEGTLVVENVGVAHFGYCFCMFCENS